MKSYTVFAIGGGQHLVPVTHTPARKDPPSVVVIPLSAACIPHGMLQKHALILSLRLHRSPEPATTPIVPQTHCACSPGQWCIRCHASFCLRTRTSGFRVTRSSDRVQDAQKGSHRSARANCRWCGLYSCVAPYIPGPCGGCCRRRALVSPALDAPCCAEPQSTRQKSAGRFEERRDAEGVVPGRSDARRACSASPGRGCPAESAAAARARSADPAPTAASGGLSSRSQRVRRAALRPGGRRSRGRLSGIDGACRRAPCRRRNPGPCTGAPRASPAAATTTLSANPPTVLVAGRFCAPLAAWTWGRAAAPWARCCIRSGCAPARPGRGATCPRARARTNRPALSSSLAAALNRHESVPSAVSTSGIIAEGGENGPRCSIGT